VTLRNLWSGVRLAFFLKCDAERFDVSPASLWAVALVIALSHVAADYAVTPHPAHFYREALETEAFYLAAYVFAGFAACLIAGRESLHWSLSVLALNALWLPLLAEWTVEHYREAWMDAADYRSFRTLFYVWVFLIAFRAMILLVPRQAGRQLAGALVFLGIYVLSFKYFALYPYWYTDPPIPYERHAAPVAEDVLPQQYELVDARLAAITPRTPGRNFYVVTVGSDDAQNVFMKEAVFVRGVLERKFHAAGHAMTLVNNRATVPLPQKEAVTDVQKVMGYLQRELSPRLGYPLATVTNLERTLTGLGKKADVNKDVLLLYITSHGGRGGSISVELGRVDLYQLTAQRLHDMLAASRFKWKVILISACYSGSFIDTLRDDHTIIVTSSRSDRVSYGCGQDNDLTYFGKAYVKEALAKTDNFVTAYEIARKAIAQREDDEDVDKPSHPQISTGAKIVEYLKSKH